MLLIFYLWNLELIQCYFWRLSLQVIISYFLLLVMEQIVSFFYILSNWSVVGWVFFFPDSWLNFRLWNQSIFSEQRVWRAWYWTVTYSSVAEYSFTLITILRENPAQIESWRSIADLQEQLCPAVTSYESSVFYVYFRVCYPL